METALLGGESSRGGGRRVFKRRSDAIAYGSTYQKAAALVDLVSSTSSSSGIATAGLN